MAARRPCLADRVPGAGCRVPGTGCRVPWPLVGHAAVRKSLGAISFLVAAFSLLRAVLRSDGMAERSAAMFVCAIRTDGQRLPCFDAPFGLLSTNGVETRSVRKGYPHPNPLPEGKGAREECGWGHPRPRQDPSPALRAASPPRERGKRLRVGAPAAPGGYTAAASSLQPAACSLQPPAYPVIQSKKDTSQHL